ncbi:MAG: hypothetical protein KGL97_18785 [Alphaproteobacteria bacterium]|nr:hypothetical protein [Alphaproteobacteria bacterium]
MGSIVDLVSSDVIFRCPTSSVAERQAAMTPMVWRYEFAVPVLGSDKPVEHPAELRYVFDQAPRDATLSTWSPLGGAKRYMEFTAEGPRPGRDLRSPVCGLLNNP